MGRKIYHFQRTYVTEHLGKHLHGFVGERQACEIHKGKTEKKT